jgi:hypothetical protein
MAARAARESGNGRSQRIIDERRRCRIEAGFRAQRDAHRRRRCDDSASGDRRWRRAHAGTTVAAWRRCGGRRWAAAIRGPACVMLRTIGRFLRGCGHSRFMAGAGAGEMRPCHRAAAQIEQRCKQAKNQLRPCGSHMSIDLSASKVAPGQEGVQRQFCERR